MGTRLWRGHLVGARLGLIEDHFLIIAGLRQYLGAMPEVSEVVAAHRVSELLSTPPVPDLVLLDLRLADASRPTDNVRALSDAGSMVLAYTSGESVGLLREAARAGVVGIVSKREPVDVVQEAVRAALRHEVVASSDWAAAVDGDLTASADLTAREREVLALYASGEKADSVARELCISRDTVLDHVRHIRTKYAAAHRAAETKVDLYRRAVEDGVLTE